MNRGCIDHGRVGNTGSGYTSATVIEGGVRKTTTLHRLVYCQHNGTSLSLIKGKVVRHMCDNPRCINPEHLELGTHKENSQDMVKRGRSGVGVKNSRAKLDPIKVRQIRELVASGKTHREVAEMFGVSRGGVTKIVGGSRWLSN